MRFQRDDAYLHDFQDIGLEDESPPRSLDLILLDYYLGGPLQDATEMFEN